MVTATLTRRGRAVLIGVLTILALTGASARVVRAVMLQQMLRRQVLAARRVLPQPVERMVAVGVTSPYRTSLASNYDSPWIRGAGS
jgi:hypothetical protein